MLVSNELAPADGSKSSPGDDPGTVAYTHDLPDNPGGRKITLTSSLVDHTWVCNAEMPSGLVVSSGVAIAGPGSSQQFDLEQAYFVSHGACTGAKFGGIASSSGKHPAGSPVAARDKAEAKKVEKEIDNQIRDELRKAFGDLGFYYANSDAVALEPGTSFNQISNANFGLADQINAYANAIIAQTMNDINKKVDRDVRSGNAIVDRDADGSTAIVTGASHGVTSHGAVANGGGTVVDRDANGNTAIAGKNVAYAGGSGDGNDPYALFTPLFLQVPEKRAWQLNFPSRAEWLHYEIASAVRMQPPQNLMQSVDDMSSLGTCVAGDDLQTNSVGVQADLSQPQSWSDILPQGMHAVEKSAVSTTTTKGSAAPGGGGEVVEEVPAGDQPVDSLLCLVGNGNTLQMGVTRGNNQLEVVYEEPLTKAAFPVKPKALDRGENKVQGQVDHIAQQQLGGGAANQVAQAAKDIVGALPVVAVSLEVRDNQWTCTVQPAWQQALAEVGAPPNVLGQAMTRTLDLSPALTTPDGQPAVWDVARGGVVALNCPGAIVERVAANRFMGPANASPAFLAKVAASAVGSGAPVLVGMVVALAMITLLALTVVRIRQYQLRESVQGPRMGNLLQMATSRGEENRRLYTQVGV